MINFGPFCKMSVRSTVDLIIECMLIKQEFGQQYISETTSEWSPRIAPFEDVQQSLSEGISPTGNIP